MESYPLNDAELIRRARGGDTSAYGELVKRYQQIAVRTAHVIVGNEGDAEDAAQEAFVKAFHALDRFDYERPFRPWLLRIVTNEARNQRRAGGRRHALRLRAATLQSVDAAQSPETSALQQERNRRILAALGELSDRDRLAIAYRYFLDLPEAETAQALGVARGTAKSRTSRALQRLREVLMDDQEFGDLTRKQSP